MKGFIFCLLLLPTAVLAQNPLISAREKVRLSLWYQGIESKKKIATAKKVRVLPDELSVPLRDFL